MLHKVEQWTITCIALIVICCLRTTVATRKKTLRSLEGEKSVTSYISILLKLDDYPAEIAWTLQSLTDGLIIDSRQAGFYQKEHDVVLHHLNVTDGFEYQFRIMDVYEDGMTGLIELYYGKSNIFETSPENVIAHLDGFVGYDYVINFIARQPIASVSPAPSRINSLPTPSPTKCLETINDQTKSNPFEKNPFISNNKIEFGLSDIVCTSHINYIDCTNERRDDCQWIFLTQGERNGICRVDPIAKCLQIGNCVCDTEDFHGGNSQGVLFHAPISVTARDISPYSKRVTYYENYEIPQIQDQNHPQDDTFFISKVDFTGRQLEYSFPNNNPAVTTVNKTILFKIHFLYTDIPIVGQIWDGLGVSVSIDTSSISPIIHINGRPYILPKKLKIWTCTQIAITPDTLYVAGTSVPRVISEESRKPTNTTNSLRLGRFTGELFDVRLYAGNFTQNQVFEVGARCASPNDVATIKKYEDLETHFLRWSCSEINPLVYRRAPTGGVQTYGSGAFATLWLAPIQDPLDKNNYLNIPEGHFDEEYFFQQAKLQSYQWERQYFENDMIAFILEPYRMFTVDEINDWSVKTFNNPCRYIHQNNNDWDFPLYGDGIVPKWTVEKYASSFGGSLDAVFDLGMLYRNKGYIGYGFFAHEAFHEFHVRLVETYDAQPSGWLQESGAESAPATLFPGDTRILASVALAPSWPLGFADTQYNEENFRIQSNPHIFTQELSLSNRIRGGHYYGTWVIWWFLSEHAGLPHLLGQMFSLDRKFQAYWHGKLFELRLLLHSNNIDLGDAWSIFVAHFRTWDFKNGDIFKETENYDFEWLKDDGEFPPEVTLEDRKTSAYIDPSEGTNGKFIPGPLSLRPTPFSWNCLTSTDIAANKVVSITIRWDDGMGFASNTTPQGIAQQHLGCDEDRRFFQMVTILYNPATKERIYWKRKGKKPSTLFIHTGTDGPVTLYIVLMPTPPVDYSGGRCVFTDSFVSPLPIYSYSYKVDIMHNVISVFSRSPPAEKMYGIVKFDRSQDESWFSPKCSCLDNPDDPIYGQHCIIPSFQEENAALVPEILKPKRTIAPTSQPTKAFPKTKNPINAPSMKPLGPNAPFSRPSQRPAANPQTPAPSQKKRTQIPTPLSPSRINTSENPNSSSAELTTSPEVPSSPTGQPRPSRAPIPQNLIPTCFSGNPWVTVNGRGLIPMRELKIGDLVLTRSGYEPVYSFGHKNETVIGTYLRILPFQLEISEDHMLFTESGDIVPASHLRVGDMLEGVGRISSIQKILGVGAYAPFTPSGSVIVNNVVASTFVAFQNSSHLKIGALVTELSYQWLAYTYESPHRIWCLHMGATRCNQESYSPDGISSWVKLPFQFTSWMIKQHPLLIIAVLLPAMCIMYISLSLEALLSAEVQGIRIVGLIGIIIYFLLCSQRGARDRLLFWRGKR